MANELPYSPQLLAPGIRARVHIAGAIEDALFPDDLKVRLELAPSTAGYSQTSRPTMRLVPKGTGRH